MLAQDFVTGWQWYLDHLPERAEVVARIVVRAVIEQHEINALVDTGATACVLAWGVAEQIQPLFEAGQPETRALGGSVHVGRVFSVSLSFPADEGQDLTLETNAWASETFAGPSLIGYGGLLEKMHTALQPEQNRFYFGS